jgi:hypothetical protein
MGEAGLPTQSTKRDGMKYLARRKSLKKTNPKTTSKKLMFDSFKQDDPAANWSKTVRSVVKKSKKIKQHNERIRNKAIQASQKLFGIDDLRELDPDQQRVIINYVKQTNNKS